MALTKQQKFDMIRDVELRLAKEELAEQYVKNLNAIENSKKPLRTLQQIVHGRDQDLSEKSENQLEDELTISEPEFATNMKPESYHQTNEDKELLEQSEAAVKKPFKKSGMDSKTQWEFIGLESLAMRESIPKEKIRGSVTEEQMQEFRDEYYGGRYDALETLRQHSQENRYVTNEQLNQSNGDMALSKLKTQDILHDPQEEFSTREPEMREVELNLQEHFENAQSMSIDNDMGMGMER